MSQPTPPFAPSFILNLSRPPVKRGTPSVGDRVCLVDVEYLILHESCTLVIHILTILGASTSTAQAKDQASRDPQLA